MEKQKRHCSEEAKARMCLAQQKRFSDPEQRRRTGETSRAASTTPEALAKKSESLKRKWADPEFRERTLASKRAASQRQDVKDKMSKASKNMWSDPAFKQRMSEQHKIMNLENPEINEKRSETMKVVHSDPEYKARHKDRMQEICSSEEWRQKVGETTKKALADPIIKERHINALKIAKQTDSYHKNMSNALKEVWKNPEYRKRMSKAIGDGQRRSNLDPQVRANRRLGACKAMETRKSYGRGWSMSSYDEHLIRRLMQLYFPQDCWTRGGRTQTGIDQDGVPIYQPLDCYSKKLKAMIEYDGTVYHFTKDRFFDKTPTDDYNSGDKLLNSWSVANGWKLIRVSESCWKSDPKRIIKLIVDSVYHHNGMQYRFGKEYNRFTHA